MLVGQFTYTACQTPGPYSSIPGWKVKQAEPQQPGTELPAAAVQAAVRPFGGFHPPAVPALATQVEIDQLPRCLRLDLLSGAYRGVAHLAAAGRDHSGRDAFFAHGLLVALTAQGPPLPAGRQPPDWGIIRPADLWAADGWLTPYRAEAIEAAVVGELPRPSEASPLNPERREDFVDLHPGQREFVFAAAERMLTAGIPLAIIGLPVEVAMWTSLITHLLLPTAGWTVTFSTYEVGSSADVLRPGGPKILGVPTEHATGWSRTTGDQAVVHDPSTPPPREPAGFRLTDGSLLPVGRWAELAEAVCAAGIENEIRAAIDELGLGVGPALDDWPLVGLPAAVLTLPSDRLGAFRAIAAMAARLVAENLPAGQQADPAVLGKLVDGVFRWSSDALGTSERMLRSLDRGPESTGPVVDRLLDGYLRALLPSQISFADGRIPWLPERLHLLRPATDRLLGNLDDLLTWVDKSGTPMSKVRALLTVARLAQRWGWLEGADRVLLERVVGDRARTWVAPLLLGEVLLGEVLLGEVGQSIESWPAIPGWLWTDVLVDELQHRLAGYPPGSVLADVRVRNIVDAAAGPLPAAYVAGETMATLTLVDGERAAAVLLAGNEQNGPARSAAQDEVLRVAAFLRSVGTADGAVRVPPDRLFPELRRWFPEGAPGAAVLADLLNQLRGTVPVADLRTFGLSVLASLPPNASTATVYPELIKAGVRANDLRNTSAEWHAQFGEPVPASSRDVSLRGAPLTRPDMPETRLLDVLAAGLSDLLPVGRRLPPALAQAGRYRLARWVLVLAGDMLESPGNSSAMDNLRWLVLAGRPPLSAQLEPLYPGAAQRLVADLDGLGRQPQLAADVLAADWVVRSRLADMGIGKDPARLFFTEPGERSGWATAVRALLRAETRTREDLSAWVGQVRRCADGAAAAAQLARAPDDRRQLLIESSAETAAKLAPLTGLLGRMRRTPARREGM